MYTSDVRHYAEAGLSNKKDNSAADNGLVDGREQPTEQDLHFSKDLFCIQEKQICRIPEEPVKSRFATLCRPKRLLNCK